MSYISSIEEIAREDIAVKLLKKGTMPLEEIADITELSIKQIQELQLEQNLILESIRLNSFARSFDMSNESISIK
jgi:predicted HTH domain antitoxin